MKLGKLIESIRKSKGILQSEIAESLDVTQANISQIENDPKKSAAINKLDNICKELGVPLPIVIMYALDEFDINNLLDSDTEEIVNDFKKLVEDMIASKY